MGGSRGRQESCFSFRNDRLALSYDAPAVYLLSVPITNTSTKVNNHVIIHHEMTAASSRHLCTKSCPDSEAK